MRRTPRPRFSRLNRFGGEILEYLLIFGLVMAAIAGMIDISYRHSTQKATADDAQTATPIATTQASP